MQACDIRVALKVSIADGFNELFGDFNDVLFPHCDTESQMSNIDYFQ